MDDTPTARLRELSMKASDIVRAISTTANEVVQDGEQSRTAYEELLKRYRALQCELKLPKAVQDTADTENAPEAYVIVLVDAHSHMFHQHLLLASTAGGSKAANQLREAVQQYLTKVYPGNDPCRIVIRAYANLKSLSSTVLKDDSRALSGFANGFCWVDAFFDFIDVGNEECVKSKIIETFKIDIKDPQCRHIFLASCGDEKYTRLLVSHRNIEDRVSIISGTTVDFGMSQMHLKTATFPNIFSTGNPLPATAQVLRYGMCWDFKMDKCFRRPCIFQHDQIAEVPTAASTTKTQFEIRGRISRPAPGLPIQAVNGMIALNAAGHRLDMYRPRPSDESWARFSARTKIKKLCTAHHLQKACDKAFCRYDHSPIDPSMRKCLDYCVSHVQCKQGGSCRALHCIRSHVCQRPSCNSKDGGSSGSCGYPMRMHGIDFNVHKWVPAEAENEANGGDSSKTFNDGSGGGFHKSVVIDEDAEVRAENRDDIDGGMVYDLIDL